MSEASSTTEAEVKERLKSELATKLIRSKRQSDFFLWTFVVVNSLFVGVATMVILTQMVRAEAIDLPMSWVVWIGIAVTLVGYCVGLVVFSLFKRAMAAQDNYSSLR